MTTTLRKGGTLPAVALTTADGARVPLRGLRGPIVVYVVHAPDCRGCVDYVRTLAAAHDALAEWGTTVRVVAPSDDDALRGAADRVRVLIDTDGVLAGSATDARATLIVADEWGEIYTAVEAGADHNGLPTPDALADWVRFIAVQCPECEQPEGEWRKI